MLRDGVKESAQFQNNKHRCIKKDIIINNVLGEIYYCPNIEKIFVVWEDRIRSHFTKDKNIMMLWSLCPDAFESPTKKWYDRTRGNK